MWHAFIKQHGLICTFSVLYKCHTFLLDTYQKLDCGQYGGGAGQTISEHVSFDPLWNSFLLNCAWSLMLFLLTLRDMLGCNPIKLVFFSFFMRNVVRDVVCCIIGWVSLIGEIFLSFSGSPNSPPFLLAPNHIIDWISLLESNPRNLRDKFGLILLGFTLTSLLSYWKTSWKSFLSHLKSILEGSEAYIRSSIPSGLTMRNNLMLPCFMDSFTF